MKIHNCEICGNSKNNTFYIAKEMMFGYRDEFNYYKCSKCGCLQISEVPENISKYYPVNYYSYSNLVKNGILNKLKIIIKRQVVKFRFGQKNIIGWIFSSYLSNYMWLFKNLCNYNSKILDIGCGNGDLLLEMNKLGFKNLKGLDPFIANDLYYPNGVTVQKKQISEIDETFDLIMLHHSFEHMENPKTTLESIYRCLNPNAYLLIRIPVVSCYAFRKYDVNWVQLDAPRHLFLHTPASINILAEETGFKVIKTQYDSTYFQFTGSEKYENNIPLLENYIFSRKQMKTFKEEANRLNKINDGDAACFILYKE